MKKWFLNNWLAKLMCLILAIVVWIIIKKFVAAEETTPRRSVPEQDIRRSHP